MHKYLIISIFCFFFVSAQTYAQSGSLITFSEIMFAPLSGESEFVELYNTSAADTIDLSGFQLKYLHTSNTDNIVSHNRGTKLNPNSFAIIFEEDYDFDNGVYNSLIPSEALIIKIDNGSFASGLSNSTDRTLLLINASGDTVDTYTYSTNNKNGISDEKILLNDDNTPENWSNSLTTNGTPGFYNSVSPLKFDLALKNIFITPEIQFAGSDIKLNFTVTNKGTNAAASFSVSVFDNVNFDSAGTSGELIYSENFLNLQSGDSLNLTTAADSLKERDYSFIIEITFAEDENLTNNISFISFAPLPKPANFKDVVINEIMYKPINDEPEWIEIYNNRDGKINLANWYFGDRVSKVKISDDSLFIAPDEYIIICEDESIFDFYEIESLAVIIKLPSLNNSADDLYIYDQYENIIDSVLYVDSWGGSGGYSLERISAKDSSNSQANWATAVTKIKATPGRNNSVTPKEYDLKIDKFYADKNLIISPKPAKITAEILNNGLNTVQTAVLNFYNDLNKDSTATKNELIYSTTLFQIEAGENISISFDYSNYQNGANLLITELDFDEDEFVENNIAFTSFYSVTINEIRNDLVINEFMPAPDSDQPEWIEVYNKSEKQINLKNYKITDEADTNQVIDKSIIINPGEYFLIIDDTSFFDKYLTNAKFIIHNFPTLNNSSDKIILLDSLNRVIDSLQYFSDWNIENGKSLERIDPENESTILENWQVSKDKNSATPGKINSVTQKNFDAGISQILFNPAKPEIGDEVFISTLINNYGKQNTDLNISLLENNTIIETTENINLTPSDSIEYKFNYKLGSLTEQRTFSVKINFEKDQDTTNNNLTAKINPGYNYNSILINEIMFGPQNGEPEWFEIYNKENYKIDLSGWSVFDILTNPERTIIADSIYFIEPKSFLLIAKDSSIINFYDNIPSKILATPFANLNNSEDGIVIKDVYDNLIDSVHYTSNWQNKTGYSIERITFDKTSNDSANWSYSIDIEQATPGRRNSLSKKDYDISLEKIYLSNSKPKYNDYIFINCVLENTGLSEANNFSVRFYINDKSELRDEVFINALNKNDSLLIKSNNDFIINYETQIFAEVFFLADEDTSNNFAQIETKPGHYFRDIIINEIMINPESGGSEWIEFYNNSNHEIDLKDWSITDLLPSPNSKIISTTNYKILPEEYFIVTADSVLFKSKHDIETKILNVDFGALGNSEDGIFIYDSYNTIIDSIVYNSNWNITKGYSIERLSRDKPAQDLTNWNSSINSNGSTAGFVNSISGTQGYQFNQVVINEIMYEPGEGNSEFIEFYNNSNDFIELGGWTVKNEKGEFYRIANASYTLKPDSYFITSADSSILEFYNLSNTDNSNNIINKTDLGLINTEQLLILKDLKGNIIDSVRYDSKWHNPNIIDTKNKSLERLNPKINSNEPSNWSTSANSMGATPGEQNSIFTVNKIKQAGLTISPNPFSPDNDGFEDFCTINYNLGIPLSQIRIKIFDDKGRLVRTLANNQPSGSTGSIIFNGLNEKRSPLKIGMYIVFFEATNAQTGQQEILKDVVVVARKL